MASTAAIRPARPRLVQGWALDKLLDLDVQHPGILRYSIQASPLRRQAIFFTLSHLYRISPEDLATRFARTTNHRLSSNSLNTISIALTTMRVRDIVQALYPNCPAGLVGAMRKLGDQPLQPLKYGTLVRMLSAPDQPRAKVLRQLDRVTETTLSVLRVIDPAFLFPDLLRHFRTTKDAEAFMAAIDLIRHIVPGVTNEALFASLKALGPTSGLDEWAGRWLAKAIFALPPSIQDDGEWQVLRTGRMMQEAASRFQNCLREKIAVCAVGRCAFIEWRAEPAILELAAVTGPGDQVAYVIEGIHGIGNGRVPSAVMRAICTKAAQVGLLVPARLGHARPYNRAARLLNVWDFGGIHGLPDDDVPGIEALIDEVIQEAAA